MMCSIPHRQGNGWQGRIYPKLNIDYFLDEIMDEDHMLDIYDYYKESTTDKVDDALDELGDDFTEEEVRLVRIKFISEMAN